MSSLVKTEDTPIRRSYDHCHCHIEYTVIMRYNVLRMRTHTRTFKPSNEQMTVHVRLRLPVTCTTLINKNDQMQPCSPKCTLDILNAENPKGVDEARTKAMREAQICFVECLSTSQEYAFLLEPDGELASALDMELVS